jgi:hypothetical protein
MSEKSVKQNRMTNVRKYSLRPILIIAQTDVPSTKIRLDTFVSATIKMGRRDYNLKKKRET